MSKQEEIKQALAALKSSTELYMVWDQQDGLMCITEYDKAAQEYEEQLEAVKDVVSSYGSEENERVVFARIEKQAYVSIYETDEHSDLAACWNEYEREDVANAELERLRKELEEYGTLIEQQGKEMIRLQQLANKQGKELEEAQQAMSEPHKRLWFKLTNERNQYESLLTENLRLSKELKRALGQEGEGNHKQTKTVE
ncbi:hypothetical protein [Paenibacillus pabuli]|uniref:hypothetical protein n=1 Tax=Paenibacillus pabuli TaxID=1472 RepID=UPI003CE7CD72